MICLLQSYDGDKERSRSSSYYDDNMSVASFRDIDEKQVFEDQLNHLQEQLVAVMIENQKQGRVKSVYNTLHYTSDFRYNMAMLSCGSHIIFTIYKIRLIWFKVAQQNVKMAHKRFSYCINSLFVCY